MTKDEWRRAIAEQSASGETIEAYCRGRGLNRKTFSVNKSKLKDKNAGFVQIQGSRQVEVVLSGGTLLRVDVRDLAAVLRALNA